MMKILFSGYHNPQFMTISEYMERAIKALGNDIIIFDDRQHIMPGRMRRCIPWLDQLDLQHINTKMVSLALDVKPDIVIVTGGHRIAAQTIRRLDDNHIYKVLWTIDAPLNFQPIIDVAPFYDHIFCQGTEAIELLKHAGIKGAHWLPVACDPDLHNPLELTTKEEMRYSNDVVFVGSYYPNRAELFEKLVGFDFGIWGPGWEKLERKSKLRGCIKGSHTPPSEWVKIYSASKIVLAVHYQDPEGRFPVYQASPRIFEALACGAFVLSDNQRDVFSLFNEGEHLARFMDTDDLIAKITYYLEHPSEKGDIARRGREEALGNHTYVHRIQKLLSIARRNERRNY
jgi:spore maturation protein CgeB